MLTEPVKESPPLTVLYDGACPLCRREIGIYRGLRRNTPICFADLSDAALPLPPGTTREQLLARSGRPPAGRSLVYGAHLQTLPALAADAAAVGVSPGPAPPGAAKTGPTEFSRQRTPLIPPS